MIVRPRKLQSANAGVQLQAALREQFPRGDWMRGLSAATAGSGRVSRQQAEPPSFLVGPGGGERPPYSVAHSVGGSDVPAASGRWNPPGPSDPPGGGPPLGPGVAR